MPIRLPPLLFAGLLVALLAAAWASWFGVIHATAFSSGALCTARIWGCGIDQPQVEFIVLSEPCTFCQLGPKLGHAEQ